MSTLKEEPVQQQQQEDLPLPFPPMPEIVLFRNSSCSDPDDASSAHSESESDPPQPVTIPPPSVNSLTLHPPPAYVSPEPHISSQFYTFNAQSHSLMIHCILSRRLATPDEIRAATPTPVLSSWRSVWKDRNEDTAYTTAWKRIQDKLSARRDEYGNEFLFFKNNSNQIVPHIGQWHEIVLSFHGDADLKHLGLKETVERIKQVWTVGAKFYGIPESYIRVCISACPVCSGGSGNSGLKSKRRRFEYTESFDVPAKEVPMRLQQLAKQHKVVLCIRQKYIRYKPFIAEVKDYACHRAGEPASKKSKVLKREPYASKRCGCGFRIRAIVPIANYNDKDKTFVYQEEGVAVFKLYAVHTGHEPGPSDGNARIMHRVVGHKAGVMMDQDMIYGIGDEIESQGFDLVGKNDGDMQFPLMQQVQELKVEVGLLEGRIAKIPQEMMSMVSRELFNIASKIRSLGEDFPKQVDFMCDKPNSTDMLVGGSDLTNWDDHHSERLYSNEKDQELIGDDEDSFGQTLGEVARWEQLRTECGNEKDLMEESCKAEKWLKCSEFDEKSILDCETSKIVKPMRHDDAMVSDVELVEQFYPENPKWYDSPCGLDTSGDGEFRNGEIV